MSLKTWRRGHQRQPRAPDIQTSESGNPAWPERSERPAAAEPAAPCVVHIKLESWWSPDARNRSLFFIALGAGLISVIVLLYVGWVLLNWRHGILLFLGTLLMAAIISGVVLNTIFLVREIRRNEQHDAFINAVTHELKTPVASIRLYLETLQTRAVDEAKRQEFYRIMLEDSDRLLGTIEQVLRTGRIGAASRRAESLAASIWAESSRSASSACARCTTFRRKRCSTGPARRSPSWAIADEVRAAVSNLIDNAVKYSGNDVNVTVETAHVDGKYRRGARERPRPGHSEDRAEADFQALLPRAGRAGDARQGHRPGTVHRALGGQAARRARLGGKRGSGARSTFVLQLPIVEMSRILVVEDEQHLAEGLRFNLEAEGLPGAGGGDRRSRAGAAASPDRGHSTWWFWT